MKQLSDRRVASTINYAAARARTWVITLIAVLLLVLFLATAAMLAA